MRLSIQHVVTSGVYMCAVHLHIHTYTGVPGKICCLNEIWAIVMFSRVSARFPAHLVSGDPVPLGLQGMETVVGSWCQACPRTAWQLTAVRKEERPRRSVSEHSSEVKQRGDGVVWTV